MQTSGPEEQSSTVVTDPNDEDDHTRCVRLRGLPYIAEKAEIAAFMSGLSIVEDGIQILVNAHGHSKGEAWVEFQTVDDAKEALKRTGGYIGPRYIEVFPSTKVDYILRRRIRNKKLKEEQEPNSQNDGHPIVMKLRGLPFRVQPADIVEFFKPAVIDPSLIKIVKLGNGGMASGEAFVIASNEATALQMMQKHRKYLANRYVEVFRSKLEEMHLYTQNDPDAAVNCTNAINCQGQEEYPYNSMLSMFSSPHVVRVRGLPYNCDEADIANFFHGLNMLPKGIHMLMTHDAKPTGEAFIEFRFAADVQAALLRDNQLLGHRYIEVFEIKPDELERVFSKGANHGAPLIGTALLHEYEQLRASRPSYYEPAMQHPPPRR